MSSHGIAHLPQQGCMRVLGFRVPCAAVGVARSKQRGKVFTWYGRGKGGSGREIRSTESARDRAHPFLLSLYRSLTSQPLRAVAAKSFVSARRQRLLWRAGSHASSAVLIASFLSPFAPAYRTAPTPRPHNSVSVDLLLGKKTEGCCDPLPLVHSCSHFGVFMLCRCSCRGICAALLPWLYCETAPAAPSLICATRGSAEGASPRCLSPHLRPALFIRLGRRRSDALWTVGNRRAENWPSACGIRGLASVLLCASLPALINLCGCTGRWRRRVSRRESAHARGELGRRYACFW